MIGNHSARQLPAAPGRRGSASSGSPQPAGGRAAAARELAVLAGVVGIMVGASLASCAKPGPQKVVHEPAKYEPDPHKQEIMLLWKEIRDWRAEAGLLKREPPGALKRRWSSYSVAAARAVCPDDREPQTPQCRDVCSLADNICDNADSICRIADEDLKGDAWAQDKCDSAKASCKEAKQRCCRCNGSSSHDDSAATKSQGSLQRATSPKVQP